MQKTILSQLLIGLIFITIFQACIGDDLVQDLVPEQVRITNAPDSLPVDEMFQFTASYFNNVGQMEDVSIIWHSSDETVLSIDGNGLAKALKLGEVTITASVLLSTGQTFEDMTVIHVAEDVSQLPTEKERQVTIRTTSSYQLEGTGRLKELASGDLSLEIDANYKASTSLPGLYVYLTNNPNTLSGAFEVGKVTTFSGAHSYTITGVDINTYSYVLYYCKPFVVKVGDGTLTE